MVKTVNFRYWLIIFIILTGLIISGILLFRKYNFHPVFEVGQPIDSLNGVYVYYNGGIDNVSGRNLTKDKYNLGLKYQCVEFVKRYYYEYFKHKMPESYGHAKDFFKPDTKDGELNMERNLVQYHNPGSSKPEPNDILVFRGTSFNPYGHVAIISKVTKKDIEIIQQNPGPYAQNRVKFSLHQSGKHWKIENDKVLGWLSKK